MTRKTLGRCLVFLPGALWVAAVCYFEGVYSFFLVALAALFHECGHLLAFSLLGLPAPRLVPVARGMRLSASCPLSYREECLIALAGPLANGVCYLVGLCFRTPLPFLAEFGEMSLMTGLCNLAPMSDLDGERILACLLAPHLSARGLYLAKLFIARATLFLSLTGSLLLLWLTGGGTYTAFLCLGALLMLPCGKNRRKVEFSRGFQRFSEFFRDLIQKITVISR